MRCLILLTTPAVLAPLLALGVTFQVKLVTIGDLLAAPDDYDGRTVTVRGLVTRPELHVTDNHLFIDYVFVLRDDGDTIVVYGRHDRTLGDLQIATNRRVQVRGVFQAEHSARGQRIENVLRAGQVTFFPPVNPGTA